MTINNNNNNNNYNNNLLTLGSIYSTVIYNACAWGHAAPNWTEICLENFYMDIGAKGLRIGQQLLLFVLTSLQWLSMLSRGDWSYGGFGQGSKFKFEFGSTCATKCKFLGAQLIMLGASISKEKVKSLTVPRLFVIFSLLL